jgi:hypothetical protein
VRRPLTGLSDAWIHGYMLRTKECFISLQLAGEIRVTGSLLKGLHVPEISLVFSQKLTVGRYICQFSTIHVFGIYFLAAGSMKMAFIWYVAPYNLEQVYRRFRSAFYLYR